MKFQSIHAGRKMVMKAAALLVVTPSLAAAYEPGKGFNPFADTVPGISQKPSKPVPKKPIADPRPAGSPKSEPPAEPATAIVREPLAPVEKGELAPVMAGDGSGLPYELWRGLDTPAVEALIKDIEIPPRSRVLHDLWRRLITSEAQSSDAAFNALRLEVLYRSGLIGLAEEEIAKRARDSAQGSSGVATALAARNALALGSTERACTLGKSSALAQGALPPNVKAQAILLSGLCAAIDKDTASAGLAADLAREQGVGQSPGLEALDAIASGTKPKLTPPKTVTVLDYKLIGQAGRMDPKDVIGKAEPALLVGIAADTAVPAETRLLAAEAAARLNAISPGDLANAYRALAGAEAQAAGPAHRANVFKALEAEQTPIRRTRDIVSFLDDMKHDGLRFQALEIVAAATAKLNPQPEISWFSETAAEIAVASGNFGMAKRWIALGGANGTELTHWLALADIGDASAAQHGESLAALEPLAVSGRFTPEALHRLATVLDALNYNVPIPLWDAASRTPQPNGGYLPPTGVLSQLQDASKKKEFGRTVLLAMQALGPAGAEGAHMIALGDSIRALKRAGLEADARKLGVEALLASWPRTATN